MVMTGAAGFIGRAVLELIERGGLGAIAELRLNDVGPIDHPTAVVVQGSFTDQRVRDELCAGGVDILLHLASLPGGASESDPVLGKSVNLDGSIALLDAVGRAGSPVVVYASSIAALGRSDQLVTDATALRPVGSYGTHKAMIELYLADLTRRGLVDGRSVRPAGIVARPQSAYAGFATAWMSDLFQAAVERRDIAISARPDTQIWLQSIDTLAKNILHAAQMPSAGLSPQRAWTLPATVVRVETLVEAIGQRVGHALHVRYDDGPIDQQPLDARAALAAGFASDGDIHALVETVLARITRQ